MEQIRKGKWSRFAARITNPPGLKWVFRSIVIAGIAALALDYFNTPIKAWLQYHVPFPGSGGQSAATVAAKESAAPQAKIESEITQPAIAKARTASFEAAEQELDARRSRLAAQPKQSNGSTHFHKVEWLFGRMQEGGDTVWPSWDELHDIGGVNYSNFTSSPALQMPAGSFTPYVLADGKTLAVITEPKTANHPETVWIVGKVSAGTYGAIPKNDYDGLQPAN